MSRITPSALGQNGGQETDPSMPKFDSSASQETIIRKQVSTEVREKSKETIAMPKKSLWKVSLHVLVFTLVGIPIVLILIALIFGAMLSGFEDWTVKEGFFYICGNLLGLGNPITNVSPETTRGEMLDILICTWSLSIACVAIGLVGNFSFVSYLPEKIEGKEYTDVTDVLAEVIEARDDIMEMRKAQLELHDDVRSMAASLARLVGAMETGRALSTPIGTEGLDLDLTIEPTRSKLETEPELPSRASAEADGASQSSLGVLLQAPVAATN